MKQLFSPHRTIKHKTGWFVFSGIVIVHVNKPKGTLKLEILVN